MKIMEIKFEMKVNLGNFEHEMLSISGSPEEGEDCDTCIKILKEKVYVQLGKSKPVTSTNRNTDTSGISGNGEYKPSNSEQERLHDVEIRPSSGAVEGSKEEVKQTRKPKKSKEIKQEDQKVETPPAGITSEKAIEVKEKIENGEIVYSKFNREIPEHKKAFQKVLEKELEATFGQGYGKDKKALDTVKPTVQFMLGKDFVYPQPDGQLTVLPAFIQEMGACIKRLSEVKSV
jgi:hypothetical protein